MINSQQKGKRFEREIAKKLSSAFDCNCKRTPNSGGLDLKGDIMSLTGILKRFSFECKNQEKLNIWKALEQSIKDSRGKIPIVIFTKNNENNYVSMQFEEWCHLLLEIKALIFTIEQLGDKT